LWLRGFDLTIGILAIQGDYHAHERKLRELGAETLLVRKPGELDQVDALVIPGGESTTFLKFLERDGFLDKLREFVSRKPTFGTCAGCIMLAKDVINPPQPSLAAIDITVKRNAYGRQLDSFIAQHSSKLGEMEMVFIRAPKIERTGLKVEILAEVNGDPVLVRQGNIMAATFHPELSPGAAVHTEFLKMLPK
jgi:pyridoxal 5'-phosphate synthase pdxT subunit